MGRQHRIDHHRLRVRRRDGFASRGGRHRRGDDDRVVFQEMEVCAVAARRRVEHPRAGGHHHEGDEPHPGRHCRSAVAVRVVLACADRRPAVVTIRGTDSVRDGADCECAAHRRGRGSILRAADAAGCRLCRLRRCRVCSSVLTTGRKVVLSDRRDVPRRGRHLAARADCRRGGDPLGGDRCRGRGSVSLPKRGVDRRRGVRRRAWW